MTRPTYHNDRNQLRVLSFESFRKAMLYAGYDKDGKFDNWKLAAEFAKRHGMYPVQETEGGKFLNIPNREEIEEYSPEKLDRLWVSMSVRYCLNIEGSIKTFVCGAIRTSIAHGWFVPWLSPLIKPKWDLKKCGLSPPTFTFVNLHALISLRTGSKILFSFFTGFGCFLCQQGFVIKQ